jgi:tripartite-type tricarboxylate transporter receptor subunit TctC
MSRQARRFLCTALASSGVALAQAPAYPDHPVKVVVGFPAGGPTDIVARLFAERAGGDMKQSFVVENKPGANSIIATEAVASSKADGYTLLAAAQNHAMIPALYADRVKFDVAKSFAPICIVAKSPTVLVVSPNLEVKTLAEFMQKVRDKPGSLTYASVGIGSAVHLATENFLNLTKLSMTHVPYKGAPPAATALLTGEVDAYLATIGSVITQVKAGKFVAIAVAADERSHLLPEVPTFAEGGVKGFTAEVWYALLAPAGTPEPALRALERESEGFAKDPGVRDRLFAAGIEPILTCGAAFAGRLNAEIATYSRVAKALNIKVE